MRWPQDARNKRNPSSKGPIWSRRQPGSRNKNNRGVQARYRKNQKRPDRDTPRRRKYRDLCELEIGPQAFKLPTYESGMIGWLERY